MNPSKRHPYTYAVLRYVHDVSTCEFINVGVVVRSSQSPHVLAKFKTTFGRVKGAFPSMDTDVFRSRMRQLQTSFDTITSGDLIRAESDLSIQKLIHSIVPADDSSLQWSPIGNGLSRDLTSTLSTLFLRFVTRFDHDISGDRRKDDDVWKLFRNELEKRNVLPHLTTKVIEVADDSIRFEHAWKNGAWHCYEPLSFDLASDTSIKDKAHRWLGQLSSVKNSQDKFKVYFLVGKPANSDLHRAYEKAVSILKKAPSSSVVEEDSALEFSKSVAEAISEHEKKSI